MLRTSLFFPQLRAAPASDEVEHEAKRQRIGSDHLDASVGDDPAYPQEEVGIVRVEDVSALDRRGRYDICEAFSPPRIAPFAPEYGLRSGWSMDVMHVDGVTKKRWNLVSEQDRAEARERVRRDKPGVTSLSPPCTKFCALQRLRKRSMAPEEWDAAVAMVDFAVEIALLQHRAGRIFVFEHPLTACSWALPSLVRLRELTGVHSVTLDMCMYGLVSRDEEGEGAAKKPTRILTNRESIRDKLCKRCDRSHRHVALIGGRAGPAQVYPEEFCRAIVDGYRVHLLATRGRQLTRSNSAASEGGNGGDLGACD